MKINQLAVAERGVGDVMTALLPLDTRDIDLQISSSVEKQFGEAIRAIWRCFLRYDGARRTTGASMMSALDCIFTRPTGNILARQRIHRSATGRIANDFASHCSNVKTRTRRSMLCVPGASGDGEQFVYLPGRR